MCLLLCWGFPGSSFLHEGQPLGTAGRPSTAGACGRAGAKGRARVGCLQNKTRLRPHFLLTTLFVTSQEPCPILSSLIFLSQGKLYCSLSERDKEKAVGRAATEPEKPRRLGGTRSGIETATIIPRIKMVNPEK